MLVGNRLEVIMVHNLPIIVVWTSFKSDIHGEGSIVSRGRRRERRKGKGIWRKLEERKDILYHSVATAIKFCKTANHL